MSIPTSERYPALQESRRLGAFGVPAAPFFRASVELPKPLPEQEGPDFDAILNSASVSHQFVCIHPYRDGNGRVSCLLMNLVLFGQYPPGYLKGDKKGRHRYGQALRRADRSNLRPLACLVCVSLIEIYEKMIVR
jgi:hypothetical protein